MKRLSVRVLKRVTHLTLAFVLAVSSLTAVAPFILSREASAVGITTVSPVNTQGWTGIDDNGNGGTLKYVGGPATPLLGAGSAQLAVSTPNQGYVLGYRGYAGLKLADLTTLSYSTYVTSGNNTVAPSVQINIVSDVANYTGYQGRLVYEPYMNGTVTDGTWQSHTASEGKWWFSRPASFGNTCGQAAPCTFDEILVAYPNAGVNPNDPLIGFKAGSSWTSFVGNVDNVKINDMVYDFESTTPIVTGITQKYETQQNGRIRVTLTFSEAIDPSSLPQGWNGSGTQFNKIFYSTQNVTLGFKGLNNNAGSYQFTVDRTAPTVVGEPVQQFESEPEDRVRVTLTFSEAIDPTSLPQGWYGSGNVFSKVFYSTRQAQVTFKDVTGNAGAPYTLSVDMTAPQAEVTYSTQARTNQPVTVTLNVDGPIADSNLLAGGWQKVVGENRYTKVYASNVDTIVRVQDNVGNFSDVPLKIDWIDREVNIPTLDFVPEYSTNSTVTVKWSNVTDDDLAYYIFEYSTASDFSSNVVSESISGTSKSLTLSDGVTYHFRVRAVDTLGNRSEWSSPKQTTIDTTLPIVTINIPSSRDSTPLVTGTVSTDVREADFVLYLNEVSVGPVTIVNGVWSYQFTSALTDGQYILRAAATDRAGNPGSSASILFNLSTTTTTPTVTEGTDTTPEPSTVSTLAITPIITNPGSVLGAADTDNTNGDGDQAVQGANTLATPAQAIDTEANNGTFWGLAWYWWVLIIGALAVLIGWLVAVVRGRSAAA
jgi:hypothetical protein